MGAAVGVGWFDLMAAALTAWLADPIVGITTSAELLAANAASASAVACAKYAARLALNSLRSSLRFAVTSSDADTK
jgi:hypothetical protein